MRIETENVTYLNLKQMQTFFFSHLYSTESLDISYNQVERIDRNTLQNLRELRELRMAGNRIATINVDSIRFLNSLTLFDIRENQFQQIPLDVLNFLETHLQTLQLERKSHFTFLYSVWLVLCV